MVRFIHVAINPYTGKIEHLRSGDAPAPQENPLMVNGHAEVPVAVPPNEITEAKPYIYKKFVIECDEDLMAKDLIEMFEDRGFNDTNSIPTLKNGLTDEMKAKVRTVESDYDGAVKLHKTIKQSLERMGNDNATG